ncbi:MAG: class I SAM-dependent methyltransferase [Mucilaginibacter sp.]
MKIFFKTLLFLGTPFTFLSALWLKCVRKVGIGYVEDKIFMSIGVLPIIDHYYQPLINPKKHLRQSLRVDRELPGIDFNISEQLNLLAKFDYNNELIKFPLEKRKEFEFFYNNRSYGSGDSEYLYNIVRYIKPKRIIEIGSGSSTFMVRNALSENKKADSLYQCGHICIEPYEHPGLDKLGVEVVRKKVECIEKAFFQTLEKNDILFIDSSHMIRPQGDVLFEYLEILPILNPGVIVHIHDIFMPKDYLDEWIYNHFLWNEQYLLEAFLTFNEKYRIIGALNYLSHNYKKEFSDKCPIFAQQPGREPGSFWIVKT